jgi:hypothetical protein
MLSQAIGIIMLSMAGFIQSIPMESPYGVGKTTM